MVNHSLSFDFNQMVPDQPGNLKSRIGWAKTFKITAMNSGNLLTMCRVLKVDPGPDHVSQ
jgi:hypothetical protein